MTGFERVMPCGLFLLLLSGVIPSRAGAQIIGNVTGLFGPATVQHAGSAGTEPLALNEDVKQGDILRTGPGARLRVTLRDASVLSLGTDTELKLDHLALGAPPSDPGSLFTLAAGFLRTLVGRLRPGSLFEIHSPSMVAAVRGTDWIESYSAGTTEIFVAEGRVLATSAVDRTDWALLDAGEGVSFKIGSPHTTVVRWGQEKINRYIEATRVP
jgi:ferric-dicitrate binding protein FerR (iron transport regulator)